MKKEEASNHNSHDDNDQSETDKTWLCLIGGSACWDSTYKSKKGLPTQDLVSPHVVSLPKNAVISDVFTGPTSCHTFFLCEDGTVYAVGSNECGQLGLGDLKTRYGPVFHEELSSGKKLIMAATGRNHSLFLLKDNVVMACGESKLGQCGYGRSSVNKPLKIKLTSLLPNESVSKVACGGQFSLLLTDQGNVYAFGSPQYGQLGHGDEGSRLISSGKIELDYITIPKQIKGAINKKKVLDIVCGDNHTIALDDDGNIYSWGRGDDGRLGHTNQVNQLVPKPIEEVGKETRNGRVKSIGTGETISSCVSEFGQYFIWGKYRTCDPNMYPKMVFDLSGWNVKSYSAGKKSIIVAAEYKNEHAVISWGQGIVHGELCKGEGKPKNSAQPAKIDQFDGVDNVIVDRVLCGLGHVFFLVPNSPEQQDFIKKKGFKPWIPYGQEEDVNDIDAAEIIKGDDETSSTKKKGKRSAPAASKATAKNASTTAANKKKQKKTK